MLKMATKIDERFGDLFEREDIEELVKACIENHRQQHIEEREKCKMMCPEGSHIYALFMMMRTMYSLWVNKITTYIDPP